MSELWPVHLMGGVHAGGAERLLDPLLTIAVVLAAFAFTPVAFAQTAPSTPANKVDCEKAKMKWDVKGGKDGKGACVAAPAAKTDAMKK